MRNIKTNRHFFWFSILLILGITAFAYWSSAAPEQTTAHDNLNEVKQKMEEALSATADYTEDQREEALADFQTRLDTLDQNIDELTRTFQQNTDKLSEESQLRMQKTIETLQKQRKELSRWYDGLKNSTGQAWEDVKQGFMRSYADIAQSFAKASKEFE